MALPPYYAQRSQKPNSSAGTSGQAPLPPQQAESMLSSLAKNIGGTVQTLGMALDTPGAIARGFLAGDPASGFAWDADRRVSGAELLDSYGLTDETTNPYLKTAAGLATEIATDPLSWLTGPLASLGKAGKAAQATDLLGLAPIAAQKRLGSEAAETLTGRFTKQALDAMGPSVAQNADTFAVRPLVGPRLAQATTTLQEVVDVAPDPRKAIDDITKYLSTEGLSFADVADEKLGGMFGLGLINSNAAYMPEGKWAETALDAMDLAGQYIGWSPVGRYASALFDKNVEGMTDAGDQLFALKHTRALDAARRTGQELASDHAFNLTKTPLSEEAQQLLGADSLLSEEGNALFLRLVENKPTANDLAIQQLTPNLDEAVVSWDKIRKHNLDSAKQLGLIANEYEDAFGVRFSPRTGSAFEFNEYGEGVGNSLFNTRTESAFARNADLIVPGGTEDLREISTLPIVREHARLQGESPYSMEEVGQAIKQYIDNKHGPDMIDDRQATGIARVMYRLKKDLPDSYPAFAEHPINMQAKSIVSEEIRRANAEFVYDSIADVASPQNANQIAGGGYKSVQAGLNEIAGKVGFAKDKTGNLVSEVADSIRARIAQRQGVNPEDVDLNAFSLPEKLIERLGRVQDFYSSPRAQQEVSGLFDQFTNLTKSFLLAWPSRHVRDAYSNAFSVWLETGSVTDTLDGFRISAAVMADDWDTAIPLLRQLPQFRNVASDDVIKQSVVQDTGRTGILMGLSQEDYLTANRMGAVQQLVPGAQPMTLSNAMRNLSGASASDFFQIRGITNDLPTRNPILNTSEAINNYNDGLARLGGMFALMKQGATADYAAQRMQAALVDYGSLTSFEKNVAKKIFPWWSYQSRIGKYVVDSMLRNPGGRYGQAIRAMNTMQASDDDTYVPSSLQQQFAFRVPEELAQALGKPEGQDTTTFITDFDIPGVDTLSMFVPGSAEDTLANVALQANPFIKTFMELSTGRDLFSKRPIRQADTGADRIYKYLTGDNQGLSPAAKALVQNIPGTQRAVNMAGGLLDTRIPSFGQRAAKQLFNATTGFKITDVDPAWQIQDARSQNLDRFEDYTREFTTRFIPEDVRATAPQDVLEAEQLEKYLSRQYRDYQKDRPQRKPIINPLLEYIRGGQ